MSPNEEGNLPKNIEKRVGVFVCHCGTNISGFVDIQEIVDSVSKMPDVIFVKDYRYLCSSPGQALIQDSIKENKLDRVVVAACSPRMHETTFRKTIETEGLNPYLLEMANIREQCSWVHMHEPKKATKKAEALIASAIAKSRLLEPLVPMKFSVTPAVLVIGGGIAGIQASLDIAEKGFKVYLVEKATSIGGHMAQLDKTFPTLDCSACILTPKMVDASRHKNITLLTYSEVESIGGFIGNFKVKIRKKPRYVKAENCTGCGDCKDVCPIEYPNEWDMNLGTRKAISIPFDQAVPLVYAINMDYCIECFRCAEVCGARKAIDFSQKSEEIAIEVGTIIIATGYDIFDAKLKPEYGYGVYKDVISNLEFERLINAAGATGGKLLRASDGKEPEKIAFFQCIGSRDILTNKWCSRICCMASIKQAHQIKERYPKSQVFVFYIDIRAFGKGYEELFWRTQEEGVNFIRGKPAEVFQKPESKMLTVKFEDTLTCKVKEVDFDMIVLATGLVQRPEAEQIQKALKLSLSPDRFFLEAHPKLRPVETHVAGVFLCGCAQGPKDITDTVAQASAAASQASIPLIKGEVTAEPTVAHVDENNCCGCKICESVCIYGAIGVDKLNKEGKSKVNEALCVGCGSCVAACPARAITLRGFTRDQLMSQLEALLTREM